MPATQCPRIPAAFPAAERASLPDWVYRQEYECSFEAAEDIAAAFQPTVMPLFGRPLFARGAG